MAQAILPIAEISPYRTGWTIKGKVTSKQDLRTFDSKRTPGQKSQVFSITIVDDKGTEISGTFWDEAANKFHPLVDEGKVFTFGRGRASLAKKGWNRTGHNYELAFGQDAVIIGPLGAEDGGAYTAQYKLVELSHLKKMSVPGFADLCVMVKSQNQQYEYKQRDGNIGYSRRLTCVDQSELSMEITLWESHQAEGEYENKCIMVKSCNIKEYNGGLSGSARTADIRTNLDHPAVAKLQDWWTTTGKDAVVQPLSVGGKVVEAKDGTFQDLKDSGNLMQVDSVEFWNGLADLSMVRNERKDGSTIQPTYDACSNCRTKLQSDQMCNKCNKVAEPKARLMLSSMKFEDSTASVWANAFDDTAGAIINDTADNVRKIQDSAEMLTQKCLSRCHYGQYDLRMRLKCEMYNGEAKSKVTIQKAMPADPHEGGKKLLQQLAQIFGSCSGGSQAQVQGLLKGADCLENLGPGFSQQWETDLRGLVAAVA